MYRLCVGGGWTVQVTELEDARSDLHETNCRERSVIHELTFNNRQLQLTEASLRDRISAADDEIRQLRADVDLAVQRAAQLDTSLQRAVDTERSLTDRCGELDAELVDWKCRLDDAMQLVDRKETELRQATAQHLMQVDHWTEKVQELMTANSSLEASEARTKRDLTEAERRENLLRKNMEELNSQLSHQEMSAAQTKDQMNSQLSAIKERLFQVENCLKAKEMECCEAKKSYDDIQSAVKQAEDEKSQLLLSLTEVRKERNDARDEIVRLNEAMSSLQDRLASSGSQCSMLEQWLSETNSKHDAAQQVWASRVETVEAEKRQLHSRIDELQNDVSCYVRQARVHKYVVGSFCDNPSHTGRAEA